MESTVAEIMLLLVNVPVIVTLSASTLPLLVTLAAIGRVCQVAIKLSESGLPICTGDSHPTALGSLPVVGRAESSLA